MKEIKSATVFAAVMIWLFFISASYIAGNAEGTQIRFDDTNNSDETISPTQGTISLIRKDRTIMLDMESYLVGVLLLEMPSDFHQQAKRAQAVAARTFALKMANQEYRHDGMGICDDPGCCQGYISVEEYLSAGGNEVAIESAREAVKATTGSVLTYDGELIDATYFSCSGGKTEDAVAVWGADIPYLQAVDSPGEENAKWHTDVVIFSKEEFQNKLGRQLPGDPSSWFGRVTYSNGGGVSSIEICSKAYSGTVLRSMLGLRSASFLVVPYDDEIIIQTRGFGHRVGLSQYGADAMARNGSTWQEILLHYYQGVELSAQIDLHTD